jgi:dihydropteroate synthase
MTARRLIEPLGLLSGAAAREAVAAGEAAPLLGVRAYLAARLIETDRPAAPVRARDIGADWATERDRLAAMPSAWAGLPTTRPAVMGVLNVTDDSFSDGGRTADTPAAIAAGRAMAEAGADMIDVGGESTRPGAEPIDPREECRRVLPVIGALAAEGIAVSCDTRNAATMAEALAAGARAINDVSGLTHDPDAAHVVASAGCPVVLMHMRGTPGTMRGLARYGDVALEVLEELQQRLAIAVDAGIERNRILLDPGFGFAKTAYQNLILLRRLSLFLNLGCRLLAGLSRKSFIGKLALEPRAERRAAGSIASGLAAVEQGASVLRVHDVPATVQALRVWNAIGS